MSKNIEKIYGLSPMQEGMLFHSLLDKQEDPYFQQFIFHIEGEISKDLFEKSYNYLIEEFDVLRTSFVHKQVAKPKQVVLKKRPVCVDFYDISEYSDSEVDIFKAKCIQENKEKGFDLTNDPLSRIILIKIKPGKYLFIWSFHHIIMDGWCIRILLNELVRIYESLKNNKQVELNAVTPYNKYIGWLENQDKEGGLDYWANYLDSYESVSSVPSNKNSSKQLKNIQNHILEFDESTTAKLNAFARSKQTTLNVVFQSVWGLLLQRYNYTDDVVFGYVATNRPAEIPGVEDMVGVFINTIPVRVKTESKNELFSSFLESNKKLAASAKPFEYLPLADIQSKTALKGDLLDHIIVFENYPFDAGAFSEIKHRIGFTITDIETFDQTNYDLTLVIYPGEKLKINFIYNLNAYKTEYIIETCQHLNNIINSINTGEDISLKQIELFSGTDKDYLQRSFDNYECNFPKNKTIVDLFEEQVNRTPEKIAVVFNKQKLSYKQLNAKVNNLCKSLKEFGVTKGDIVAVVLDRNIEIIISFLAILKSGGAYLPIDPDYPNDRINYILEDSIPKAVISSDKNINAFIDKAIVFGLNNYEDLEDNYKNPISNVSPRDLAYIIYTSGTTGQPKGVMIEHRNVVRLFSNSKFQFDFNSEDIWTMFHSPCFDFSVWEMYGALLFGGKLIVIPKEIARNPEAFIPVLEENKVTILNQTPSAFYALSDKITSANNQNLSIRSIIFGGEALTPALLKHWYALYPQVELINMFGITETTVHVTYKQITPNEIDNNISNIGKPIPTLYVYVLDKNMNFCPKRVPGELYVGGEGVARGYLHREELTNEKFINDPYRANQRLYKTGDLVRILDNEELEYISRADQQVQIRGFRIEVGEIENRILSFVNVKNCVVLAIDDSNSGVELAAYIVTKDGVETEIKDLRLHLEQFLPVYMIPSYFVLINEIPLTLNGKVDRKVLPSPYTIEGNDNYKAPYNEVQEQLVNIFKEVLKIEKVGINDNFFEIGGHSLKATQLISRINKVLGKDIQMTLIFKYPTIEELEKEIQSKEEKILKMIAPIKEQSHYELSYAQKRLWIISNLKESKINYNIPSLFKIKGEINIEILEKAINLIIDRHEILRTSFTTINNTPMQVVSSKVQFVVKRVKILSLETQVNEDLRFEFNLSKAPLLNAKIYKQEKEKFLFLNMHHIISDGWSVGVFAKELMHLYSHLIDNKKSSLPKLSIQYKDFAVWQTERILSDLFKKSHEYWMQNLGGDIPVLEIPADKTRPLVKTYNGLRVSKIFSEELSKNINQFSQANGVTLYTTLLASINILLYKYTGQKDIILGMPIAGRTHPDLENQMGFYVNTLPVRTFIDERDTYLTLLNRIKETLTHTLDFQDYPLDKVIDDLKLARDTSRNALFDIVVLLQNNELPELSFKDFSLEPIELESNISKFDISFVFQETDSKLNLEIEYNIDIFSSEKINSICSHLSSLLNNIAENSNKEISSIEYLSDAEKKQLLFDFNDANDAITDHNTFIDLFDKQVSNYGDNVAIKLEGKKFTYSELNTESNIVANYLLDNFTIKSDDIIGVMCDRNEWMIIAILGILKSGAAFLPVDSTYPGNRIKFMLSDSKCKLLLSNYNIENDFEGVKTADITKINSTKTKNPNVKITPNNLAYIIYTSGSTGTPKGTMLEHKGWCNLFEAQKKAFDISTKDVILQFASISFDASCWELSMTLLSGATLLLIKKETIQDIREFDQYIHEHKATILTLPPSFLKQLPLKKYPFIRILVTAGDSPEEEIINFYRNECRYFNAYGPTEYSVCATYHEYKKESANDITIGKPINNTTLYILDKNNKLLPKGFIGELCISGLGIARGYLNRPDLNKEKFIINPFNPNEKLYKTGDLAKWNEDGTIKFIGRKDKQVKINGYRIEVEEIKFRIISHPDIKDCVVIVKENGSSQKELAAYIILKNNQIPVDISSLRVYMGKQLPDYMIPGYFIFIDEIPLNSSGKVDEKVLSAVDNKAYLKNEFVAPGNPIENLLADVWQKTLGSEKISVHDNFFEIGGNSLKAIQISAELFKDNISINLQDIYSFPSIKQLAELISSKEMVKIDQKNITGIIKLTPIQKWFFDSSKKGHNHFNNSVTLYNPEGFNKDYIQEVLTKLVTHHDCLRCVYKRNDDDIVQYNRDINESLYNFTVVKVKSYNENTLVNHINKQHKLFNIEKGPLVNSILFQTDSGDYLTVIIHHLVVDMVSWGIIIEDLKSLNSQRNQNTPFSLPAKTHSFKTWSEKINELANSDRIKQQSNYWKKIEETEIISIKDNNSKDSNSHSHKGNIKFELSNEDTHKLMYVSKEILNSGIDEIILSGLVKSLYQWKGTYTIVINQESHGRESLFDDIHISRTVGWFTSQYPVVIKLPQNKSIENIIDKTKETFQQIPDNGVGYSIWKYLTQGSTNNFIPEISFNYLGELDSSKSNVDKLELIHFENEISIHDEINTNQILEINCFVKSKKLIINFTYNSNLFEKKNIENFVQIFGQIFSQIISINNTSPTESKNIINNISKNQLKEIVKEQSNLQLSFSRSFIENGVEDQYPISGIQHITYKNNNCNVFWKLNFDYELDYEILNEAYFKISESQEMLRCYLSNINHYHPKVFKNIRKSFCIPIKML